ncbi:ABC transporter permease [Phreatobacter sp. AB_2022a]|uniref:ABC transporter permease n=1 Tax=Phreatobacter sp. AB_2022a TaxID=3003134 RepID=UPI0022872E92|nr:ABC transporter permease [Phreatobacter sp. AB_2022a]MCZ0733089.1 ABC transporter permease [Phreatobacter sp. AB_2022a]
MLGYVLRRLVATIPVLVLVALLVFFLLRLTPGDPAILIAGDQATTAQIAEIREKLGFDRPLTEQLFTYAGQLARGDLGTSIFSGMAVTRLIAMRVEPTAMLALVAIVLALVIAVPLGTLAAVRAGSAFDRAVMAFAMLGFSSPVFVIAFLLVYVFALGLGWFPTQGYVPLAKGLGPCLNSLALPGLTLALLYAALIARITRASLLEVLAEDYMRTARAKGLMPARVVLRHALKNAAIPIVTVVGVGIAALLGGVVVTETVFNIPGLGRLTTDAILRRDYPVVQGLILVFSALYVLINLLVDLSYVLFDPRVQY